MREAAVPLDETLILHLFHVSVLLHELQVSFQEDRCVSSCIAQNIDGVSVAFAADWSDRVLVNDLVVLFHDLAETDRTVSNELMRVHIDVMDRQRARNWRPKQPEYLEVRPVKRLEAVELAMHVHTGRLIRQVVRAVKKLGSSLHRMTATPALMTLPEFGQVKLLDLLLRVCGQVLPLIGAIKLTLELHCSLENCVGVHLAQLFDALSQHFVNLEHQESVLAEQLASEVLVLVVVH